MVLNYCGVNGFHVSFYCVLIYCMCWVWVYVSSVLVVVKYSLLFLVVAVEAGLSVYVVGGQGVRLFVVVVSCGVLDVFLLGGFLSRHVCDLC